MSERPAIVGAFEHPLRKAPDYTPLRFIGECAAAALHDVNAFTVVHQTAVPAFRDRIPYVVAYVELEEGLFVDSNVINCDPNAVKIGMPLTATFEKLSGEAGATLFEPA